MEWYLNIRELSDQIVVNEDHLDAMSLAEAILKVQEYIGSENVEFIEEYDKKTGKVNALIMRTDKCVILLFNESRQKRYIVELRAGFNNISLVPEHP